MKQKKCKRCKSVFVPRLQIQPYCGPKCALETVYEAKRKKLEQAKKEYNKETKRRKKKLKTRADWYADLQKEVNLHVRLKDAGKPCCTCGTTNDIKYDAGHYRTVGSSPELRFELTNIHHQCSMQCNVHGSGMRKEYQDFLADKYGADHLEWLNGPHTPLKEQFPHVDDIQAEIKRYRLLNKQMK